MTDFEKVIDFENMYRAFRKSRRGKGHKTSAIKFDARALEGVNLLIDQIKRRTYTVSPYTEFKVYEPKERDVKTCSFKDKVVQHCLCDNVILPRLETILVEENSAGRKGKGNLYALDLLSKQMALFYEKYEFNGYILKCDVKKYFYNIDHEALKKIVEYHFGYDEGICWLCNRFIDSTEGKGLALGNQINQGFAILYLDGMDKLIKYELGIEYFGRYMDDFYLIHQNKEYLKECLETITEYLDTLGLQLNTKTQIFPFKNGISFLGFHSYAVKGGKVIRRLKNQNKRNAQKKYARMARLVKDRKISRERFEDSYQAWKNHISHGNCYKLGLAMDEKIKRTERSGDGGKP